MNTKKNKNKPKQHKPNPQPKSENIEPKPQEVEAIVKEDIIEVPNKPDIVKSDEQVPVVSEKVTPILEAKVSEGDTPKKPKRNRGKKKKTDKDDDLEEEIQDNKTPEPIIEEAKTSLKPVKAEPVEITEEKSTDATDIAPAARKKKNKNKKPSELTEKTEEIKIAPLTKEELADVKIITCVPVTTETDESKSKKKNKKKKRTDSERSDKADDVISCTAAFQILLQGVDKKDEKVEENKPDIQIDTIKEIFKDQPRTEQVFEKDAAKPEDKIPEAKDEGGKNKKKNKKDKKNPPKISDDSQGQQTIGSTTETVIEEKAIILSDNPVNVEPIIEKPCSTVNLELPGTEKSTEKEKSPKPKNNIAKPVDKKRKGKADGSSTENLIEKCAENTPVANKGSVPVEIPPIEAASENKEDLKPINLTVTKLEESKENKTKLKEEAEIPKVTEAKDKQVTDMSPSKKGKKGKQKLSEATETEQPATTSEPTVKTGGKFELRKDDVNISSMDIQKEVIEAKSETVEVKTDVIENKLTILEETTKANIPIPLGFEPLTPTKPQILETQETEKRKEEINPVETQTVKTGLQVPDTGSSKKRKKSPKRSKTLGKTAEVVESVSEKAPTPTSEDLSKVTEESILAEPTKEPPQEISEELKESITELPTLEDIDIRSVKTEESDGSACDITPDIQYPRASSQLLDNNNNTTVIRDVTTKDVKLEIPVVIPDTPLIKGSGETPLPCTESLQCAITITEIEPTTSTKASKVDVSSKSETVSSQDIVKTSKDTTTKVEEKTDLKSRVLDVNQGMEELRKSIERSLAELSAIEKNERNAEEQFAKAQSKLEEIKDIAAKRSEEKKEMGKKEKAIKTLDPTLKTEEAKVQGPKFEMFPSFAAPKIENLESKVDVTQTELKPVKPKLEEKKVEIASSIPEPSIPPPPPLPTRKDNKGKGKKKKGKQDTEQSTATTTTTSTTTECSSATTETKESQDSKKEEKPEEKTDKSDNQSKGKQQSDALDENNTNTTEPTSTCFEPIENFEDAMTSSVDDVNKTFEMIAVEANQIDPSQNPEINITAPTEDNDKKDTKEDKNEKVNPVSQPKNLLGHPNIPARLNKADYKKEKDKSPNLTQAKVKIKDDVPIEVTKQSKESQTENKRRFLRDKTAAESVSSVTNDNEEYIYKYSFRKVFLPSACHICKKDLKPSRVSCSFCNLVFYCSAKHKDEDYAQHQAFCFAVSTIVHLKEQKHIYADTKNITGQEYRLVRMQMIVSCEKVLKRRLVPWEQEALLYPRLCADVGCREWRQNKLVDCEGCEQIAYCLDNPDHLPKSHQRWCKSYSLYHRLVVYQQTKGRLEPKLPTRVMAELYQIPEKLNEVLASMYEEKIDMTDIQYAALTQIATAPLTAAYCQQLFTNKMNGIYANGTHKKSSFTIHVVGAELQFEADALNKWEVFFLHLRPDVKDLRVVLVGPELNPNKLPLDLLGKIKLCQNCRQNKRRVLFEFQDNKSYYEYWSTDFSTPDLVCAFNPSIQRSSVLNGKDTWPTTIKCIMKLRVPFIITSYTMNELIRDLARVKNSSENDVGIISEPKYNAFASVRPDRNFISDDEMPLLFKNFCFTVVCGSM